MKNMSVRLSDEENVIVEKYAKLNRLSKSKALKDAFFEKIEDEYDINLFDKAYANYLKDKTAYTTREVCKQLGI